MQPLQKSATLLCFTVAALIGFFILPLLAAVLWLIFCIVAFPVWVSFLSGALSGTTFSATELNKIYKESINTVPSLLKFLTGLVARGKK
jgi:hypothetical protein